MSFQDSPCPLFEVPEPGPGGGGECPLTVLDCLLAAAQAVPRGGEADERLDLRIGLPPAYMASEPRNRR